MKSKYGYGALGGAAVLWMGAMPWLSTGGEGDCHCDVLYVTLLAATAVGLYFVARGLDLRALDAGQMNWGRRLGNWLLRIGYGLSGFVWGLATVVLLLGFVSSFIATMLTQLATTGDSRMRSFLQWRTALFGLGSLVGGLNAASLLWLAVWGSTSMGRYSRAAPRDESPRPA